MTLKLKTLFAILAAAASLYIAPRPALAWDDSTHRLAGKLVIDYMPSHLKDTVVKYSDDYYSGVDSEQELFDAYIAEHGRFSYGAFINGGVQRMMYHLGRIRALMEKSNYSDVLAFSLGQYVRCATDLLEPLPEGKEFNPLEVSANRKLFLEDFAKYNPKFDYLYDGRGIINSFPIVMDTIAAKNKLSGAEIYRIYHVKRSFRQAENHADAAFNRALNFISDSLSTFDWLMRSTQGQMLDMRTILGIDRLSRYSENGGLKIDTPEAPDKPDTPSPKSPQKVTPKESKSKTTKKNDKTTTKKPEQKKK